tara:strand:- start:269 stop:688 length:420 start_codon:yes stop_codon:yes gene_type:complete
MILYLIIGIIIFIISVIRWYVWNQTREKLDNENEKKEFLRIKFIRLVDSEISKGVELDEIDAPSLNLKMAQKFQKKGIIKDVNISQPKYASGEWKVQVTVTSGTWPISDKKEYYTVFSISDIDLNQLTEFIEYLDDQLD